MRDLRCFQFCVTSADSNHNVCIYIYILYIYRTKRWEFGNGTICHQTCGLTRTNGDIVGICWGYNADIVGISGIYIYNQPYDSWVCPKTGYTVPSINGIFSWGKLWHKNLKKSSYGVPYCQTKPDDLGCGMTTGGGFHEVTDFKRAILRFLNFATRFEGYPRALKKLFHPVQLWRICCTWQITCSSEQTSWIHVENIAEQIDDAYQIQQLPSGKLTKLWNITMFNGKIYFYDHFP